MGFLQFGHKHWLLFWPICFLYIFYFQNIALSFLSWHFDVFHGVLVRFLLLTINLNNLIEFILWNQNDQLLWKNGFASNLLLVDLLLNKKNTL